MIKHTAYSEIEQTEIATSRLMDRCTSCWEFRILSVECKQEEEVSTGKKDLKILCPDSVLFIYKNVC